MRFQRERMFPGNCNSFYTITIICFFQTTALGLGPKFQIYNIKKFNFFKYRKLSIVAIFYWIVYKLGASFIKKLRILTVKVRNLVFWRLLITSFEIFHLLPALTLCIAQLKITRHSSWKYGLPSQRKRSKSKSNM